MLLLFAMDDPLHPVPPAPPPTRSSSTIFGATSTLHLSPEQGKIIKEILPKQPEEKRKLAKECLIKVVLPKYPILFDFDGFVKNYADVLGHYFRTSWPWYYREHSKQQALRRKIATTICHTDDPVTFLRLMEEDLPFWHYHRPWEGWRTLNALPFWYSKRTLSKMMQDTQTPQAERKVGDRYVTGYFDMHAVAQCRFDSSVLQPNAAADTHGLLKRFEQYCLDPISSSLLLHFKGYMGYLKYLSVDEESNAIPEIRGRYVIPEYAPYFYNALQHIMIGLQDLQRGLPGEFDQWFQLFLKIPTCSPTTQKEVIDSLMQVLVWRRHVPEDAIAKLWHSLILRKAKEFSGLIRSVSYDQDLARRTEREIQGVTESLALWSYDLAPLLGLYSCVPDGVFYHSGAPCVSDRFPRGSRQALEEFFSFSPILFEAKNPTTEQQQRYNFTIGHVVNSTHKFLNRLIELAAELEFTRGKIAWYESFKGRIDALVAAKEKLKGSFIEDKAKYTETYIAQKMEKMQAKVEKIKLAIARYQYFNQKFLPHLDEIKSKLCAYYRVSQDLIEQIYFHKKIYDSEYQCHRFYKCHDREDVLLLVSGAAFRKHLISPDMITLHGVYRLLVDIGLIRDAQVYDGLPFQPEPLH